MQAPADTDRLAAHLGIAGELNRLLAKSAGHPSALVSEFLGRKKHLTREDRRVLSAAAFIALRNRLLLAWCIDPRNHDAPSCSPREPVAHAAAAGILFLDGPKDQLAGAVAVDADATDVTSDRWIRAIETAFSHLDERARLLARETGPLPPDDRVALAARCSMPAWILERWESHLASRQRAFQRALSLCVDAPVCLRVNTRRTTVDDLIDVLRGYGIAATNAGPAPAGIVLDGRHRVTELPAYSDGLFEVQDTASQMAAFALAPAPGMRILDACAGAGGKSLHLADMLNDDAVIVALDTEELRLRALRARARRSGLSSIRAVRVRGADLPGDIDARIGEDAAGSFEAVLVDAPCSALGTARRNPMVKWRLTPRLLDRLAERQRRILSHYARCVAPGGALVYTTCSLMREENEDVVSRFLDAEPDFTPDQLPALFGGHGDACGEGRTPGFCTTFAPDTDGTDGFFISRMRRV